MVISWEMKALVNARGSWETWSEGVRLRLRVEWNRNGQWPGLAELGDDGADDANFLCTWGWGTER